MRGVIICPIAIALCLITSCRPAAAPVSISNRPASINDRPTTNVPMPPSKPIGEMTWTDEKGVVTRVADLKGKALVLDFWATYCPPCKQEIPHLNSLIKRYGADNLVIIGLNVGGDEDKPEIPKFVAETKLDYPIAFPEDALTKFVFASDDSIPQTLIIDRNGQIVKKVIGFSDRIKLDLDAAVNTAIQTK